MLAVMLKIGQIEYDGTLKAILPWVVEQVNRQGAGHWVARLLRDLGDDADRVALGVLGRLGQEAREELLVHCANACGPLLTRKANEALARKYGPCVSVGALWMERDEGLYLQLRQVRVAGDSLPGQLLSQRVNPLLRMLAAAVGNDADSLESALLGFFGQRENRRRLLKELQGVLDQHGLGLRLEDLDLAREPDESPFPFRQDTALKDDLKIALVDAVAGYLKAMK